MDGNAFEANEKLKSGNGQIKYVSVRSSLEPTRRPAYSGCGVMPQSFVQIQCRRPEMEQNAHGICRAASSSLLGVMTRFSLLLNKI